MSPLFIKGQYMYFFLYQQSANYVRPWIQKKVSTPLLKIFFFSSHSVTSHEISQPAPPTGVSTTLKNFLLTLVRSFSSLVMDQSLREWWLS